MRLLYAIAVVILIGTMGVETTRARPGQEPALLNLRQASSQQSDEKVIEKDSYINEPVEIDNLSVKNVRIALHQKLSARSLTEQGGGQTEDWLEDLEFTVKNKSEKRVTYLSVSLRFPMSGNPDTSVGMFYHFVFGVDLRASGQAATYREPFSLEPGASLTVRLSDKGLKEIRTLLALSKRSLAEVDRVFLRVSIVGYEDGLQWQLGEYSRPEKQKQSDKKVVELEAYDNEPYEISDLSVKNVKIPSQERLVSQGFTRVPRDSYEFSAASVAKDSGGQAGDWLENLAFVIKNTSDKQITYIALSIQFPETQVNGPSMAYNALGLGIHPIAAAGDQQQGRPLALAPGDTTNFKLSPQQLKLMKDFLALRKFQLAVLNRAVVRIETVIFDTGIMWSFGHYYKPSASAAGRFERIEQ